MSPGASTSGDTRTHSAPGSPARPPHAPAPLDLWLTARRVVRGRLRQVIGLSCLAAALGTLVGLNLGKRLYSATGLVRIASALPPVMKETDQNRPMANFDGFLQAQREVMTGRDVIDAAFQDEAWQKLRARGRTPTQAEFASCLKVDARQRSDFLQVKFTYRDSTVAAAAVQSVIGAYRTVFTREQEKAERARTEILEQRRADLSGQLATLEKQFAPISRGRTLTEVDPLCQEVAERIRKLRGALTDVQVGIAGGPELAPKLWERVEETAAENGHVDPGALYAAQLAKLERELMIATTAGLLGAHPTVVRLESAIQACKDRLAALPKPIVAQAESGTTIPKLLQEREASLRALLQSAQDEMRALAAEREHIRKIEEESYGLRQQLADTTSRIDALKTEAATGGRLMVVSGGNRPMTAMVDNRKKMALAGALFGGVAPMALLLLSGVARRTYRSGEQLAEDLAQHVPFVAVLPEVQGPGALGMMAARCVHDIRARLHPRVPDEPRVYLVASASPDEGKGALAMSLGFSCAAVGMRTIIVDGDLTSRGVTMSLGAGESAGLIEAIGGQEPVIQRLKNGPSILASGLSTANDACRLDPAALRRVLSTLRERFDIILVVGDPILTGITATVVAPQCDGVILAVSHGQQPQRVKQAVRQIEMLGTNLSVAVFNRADPSDLPMDVNAREDAENVSTRAWPEKVRALGPLVANVLSSLSHTRDEDIELTSPALGLARTDQVGRAAQTTQDGDQSDEASDGRSRLVA